LDSGKKLNPFKVKTAKKELAPPPWVFGKALNGLELRFNNGFGNFRNLGPPYQKVNWPRWVYLN